MAYDEKLAEKVRERFADLSHVEEKEMRVSTCLSSPCPRQQEVYVPVIS